HERERIPGVSPREEQTSDEPQREEDARAREDRACGVARRNSRELEDHRVDGEGRDEWHGSGEDGKEQATPRVAGPGETRRKVEQQPHSPGGRECTLDMAKDLGGVRGIRNERGVGRASADAAGETAESHWLGGQEK